MDQIVANPHPTTLINIILLIIGIVIILCFLFTISNKFHKLNEKINKSEGMDICDCDHFDGECKGCKFPEKSK